MLAMMTEPARKLYEQLMELPDDERRKLAWKVLDGSSFDEDHEPFDDEQLAEIDLRVRQILAGEVKGEDTKTVLEHVEKRLREVRR